MSNAIGAMRERVLLQSPLRVADEIGGAAISWVNEGAVWAEIVAGSASENVDHDRTRGVANYRLTINRVIGLRVGWRVLWDERALRVVGVADDAAPRMTLICEEGS